MKNQTLPIGVTLTDLTMNQDERGTFTEIYRDEWKRDFNVLQWNHVNSNAGVLRGVHVHKKHYDLLTVIRGSGLFGLHDLRENSSSKGLSVFVELSEKKLAVLCIPPGVAHGFYFNEQATHIYGVSEYWDKEDELGCHFLSKELNLAWPNPKPFISKRDEELTSYAELISKHSF